MMRLNKIITLTFFYLFLGCYQTVAWGQTINGKIIDDKQLPIDGATIILQAMDSTYIGASISIPTAYSFLKANRKNTA